MTNDDITKAKKIIADTRGKPDLEEVFIAGALDPVSGWESALITLERARAARDTSLSQELDAGVAMLERTLRLAAAIYARRGDSQTRADIENGFGNHFAAALAATGYRAMNFYQQLGIPPSGPLRAQLAYEAIRVGIGVFIGDSPATLSNPIAAIAKTRALAKTLLLILEAELAR